MDQFLILSPYWTPLSYQLRVQLASPAHHALSLSCNPRRSHRIGIYHRNIGKNWWMHGCVMGIKACMTKSQNAVEGFGLMQDRLLSEGATYCSRSLRLLRATFSPQSSSRSVRPSLLCIFVTFRTIKKTDVGFPPTVARL